MKKDHLKSYTTTKMKEWLGIKQNVKDRKIKQKKELKKNKWLDDWYLKKYI